MLAGKRMALKKRLYADVAAATPLSPHAREELVRLLSIYGNPGALHSEGVGARKELEQARHTIAKAIGAHPDEIVFTASGTEANNLAIAGVLRPLLQKYKSLHTITCAIEHQSVLEPLRALKREGLELTELEVDQAGLVNPEALRRAIKENTVFVSIQMVNSEIGTIEPIREIAKELRRKRPLQKRGIFPAKNFPMSASVEASNIGIFSAGKFPRF